MIYIVILFVLLALVWVYDCHTNTQYKRSWYWLMCVVFTCVAGFRYRLGIDTIAYMDMFENSIPVLSDFYWAWQNEQLEFEFGSALFFSLCKTLFGSWYVTQFIISLITNIAFFLFSIKNSKYPFTVILLYFCIFYFDVNYETLRQALALSVSLWAFEFLKKKAFVPYYALSIVAFLFHNVAIVLLIIPFLQFKLNYKVLALIVLFCYVATGIFTSVFSNAAALLESLPFGTIGKKAVMYVENDTLGMGRDITSRNWKWHLLRIVCYIGPVIVVGYLCEKCAGLAKERYITPYVLIWSMSIALKSLMEIFYRIQEFMCPVVCIVLAEIIIECLCQKAALKKILACYACVCMLVLWNYERFFVYSPAFHSRPRIVSCYPYSNCFTQEIDPDREQFYREVGRE